MNYLFERIYGCEAAGSVGNSMGEIVEGWTVDERKKRLGYVEELLPVDKPDFDGRLNRTNCKAHTAGSLSGALKGISAVPQDWVKTVDDAMAVNPYTVSTRSCKETAEGIYKAAMNNIAKMQYVIDNVKSLTEV